MKYFFSLHWRNIKGTFIKGFTWPLDNVPSDVLGGPILMFYAWGIHVLTMPITLTLGAGLKTLMDYFTRKYTPLKQVNPTLNAIENAGPEEINNFINKVTSSEYSAASNSSKYVKNALLAQNENQDFAISKSIAAKREELLRQQLIHKPSPIFAENEELRDEFLEQYNSYRHSSLIKNSEAKAKELRIGLGRELFKDYLKDEKNNGKKLFQNLISFFNRGANLDNSDTKDGKKIIQPNQSCL